MSRYSRTAWSLAVVMTCVLLCGKGQPVRAGASDIVLYASDVSLVQGNWSKASASDVAGGAYMSSVDRGWSTTDVPLASPADYFEAAFQASSSTPYHVWLRLRASGNSKWN